MRSESKALVVLDRYGTPRLSAASDAASFRRAVRGPKWMGGMMILAFLGSFLAWGFLAPLAGGAVAAGIISPDGSRRVVQHLEGGIIARLNVKDGDEVTAGQPLVVLQSIQPETVMRTQLNRYLTLVAMRARLIAEQEGAKEIRFPDELLAEKSPELPTILEGQRTMFETRRNSDQRQREILRRRIEQSQHQIKALEAQASSAVQQLELIAEELKGKRYLLQKDLIRKAEVLSLERARAEIEGRRGEYLGMISRAEQQIGETEVQILALDAERADAVSEQMDKVRVELADVTERLQSSRDIYERTIITAPVNGTVVNLRFKTIGGVIKAGEPILDIVPVEETLLIEARISPVDIDVVHPGLAAQVHLTAFSRWALPRIDGVVRSVSADAMVDETTGQTYYMARVEVDPSELKQFNDLIELQPGMPAEVLIVSKERTFLDYLAEPFRNVMRRSFREA
ncbi:Type I secretion system membrane fusion protein PrsE [Starkeya nomas]|uniref:Membrane fusion protein (MFP) family protein n=1 Tax=Starkeya nomas TaxID=2666134 RepID=A0A5S9P7A0_9HYPH|nr:HlyD family type I secretion periplasmic adaptor subunit [Starkeya nomas]CAA0099286.1 Type I secretion system membrane fusion protein PrsE [Starkeya nomas]